MERVKVKILGISCAHRSARNTTWLTLYALKAAEKFGRRIGQVADVETELIDLADRKKEIKPCLNCDQRCLIPNEDCIIKDDYLARELMTKVAEADAFIFGAPVFTLSYTSRFIVLFERLRAGILKGYFTNKPAGAVTTASMPIAGQESCLESMAMCMSSLEMIPAQWGHGASSISGPPYGPLPGDDDGTAIGVEKHRYGQMLAVLTGRRVAEVAVLQKIAKRRLGNLYNQEFIQIYHPPHGDAPWEWASLDKQDEDYMASLDTGAIEDLDEKIISRPKKEPEGKIKCKFLGLSCDNNKATDTSWLVIYSLKAIERFGRHIESIASFETEFIDIADKKIRACLNCDQRYEIPNKGFPWTGSEMPQDFGCIIKNDYMARKILPKIGQSDGFIFGSSVSNLTPSSRFRLLSERLCASIWSGDLSGNKPTTNIAVGHAPNDGQASCLHIMNTCNRAIELIPVSWLHGTSATGDGKLIAVKNDQMARFLSIFNARRVAEFALISKLAKQELGDLYTQEFLQIIHPPHGEASWEWARLDKEEETYLQSLTPTTLAELTK